MLKGNETLSLKSTPWILHSTATDTDTFHIPRYYTCPSSNDGPWHAVQLLLTLQTGCMLTLLSKQPHGFSHIDSIITHVASCTSSLDHSVFLGMPLQVFPQQARPVEALAAQRAAVRLLSRVEPHVVPEGRRRGERFLTERAGVEVLLSVGLLVVAEARPGSEAFGAQRAGERPLSGVNPLMLDEMPSLNEAAAAHRAVVWLLCGVLEAVPPQAAQLGVAGPAVWAGVRLLAGVDPLVHHHIYLFCEALPAHGAAVRLVTRVRGHVVRQPRRTRELPAAY